MSEMIDVSDIYAAALALPVTNRLELARKLIDSLAEGADECPPRDASDEELTNRLALVAVGDFEVFDRNEVMRHLRERIAQCDRGEVELVEHEEAMQRVRAALAAREKT